jgi:peptidyl-prolyl cis-trans isomerase D
MLEAIRDRAQGWIAKVILALITIPFALWGIESYFNRGGNGEVVAEVGKTKIYRQEFVQALRTQTDQLRRSLGEKFDPQIVQGKEFRKSVLDGLINQDALLLTARDARLVVPDQEVHAIISQIPAFQDNGQFSLQRYQEVLLQNGLTESGFEQQTRQEILLRTLQAPLAKGVVASTTDSERLALLLAQQREVSWVDIQPSQFAAQAQPSESDIEAYYNSHKAEFTDPEAVKVNYVVLSKAALASQYLPTEQQIEDYYRANQGKYGEPELRTASHILIAAPKGDASARQKAKAKAEAILAEVRKNPAKFAEIARRESQDPGSAANGGNLGPNLRGVMVKPFDDAVFSMKVGQIVGPVETDFGYHIIKLDAITPATERPLANVRNGVIASLQAQQGERLYAEAADNFSNTVYDQPDSLEPVAKAYKLPIQHSDWITRKDATGIFSSPKLQDAIFSSDSIKSKENTDAVEVSSGTLVSARVVDYRPAKLEPLTAVSETIKKELIAQKSARLAEERGKSLLDKLAKGEEAGLAWSSFQMVSRQQPGPFSASALSDIFRAQTATLPVYTGVGLPDGVYRLVRISRVSEPSAMDPNVLTSIESSLRQTYAAANSLAYLTLAKSQNKVEIKSSALESGQ